MWGMFLSRGGVSSSQEAIRSLALGVFESGLVAWVSGVQGWRLCFCLRPSAYGHAGVPLKESPEPGLVCEPAS